MNNLGEAVGFYSSVAFVEFEVAPGDHGLLFSAGQVKVIDFPGRKYGTKLYGINDKGDIVGAYTEAEGIQLISHAFKIAGGQFTRLFPDSEPFGESEAHGINNAGMIVGKVGSRGTRGFVLSPSGQLKVFDFPGAYNTAARAINDAGDIVGFFNLQLRLPSAFLLTNGEFVSFDAPEAGTRGGTNFFGINNAGQIVGRGGNFNPDNFGNFITSCQPRLPKAVVIAGGDGQKAAVGTRLSKPLILRVTGAGGYGVEGVVVNFSLSSGSGSLGSASSATDPEGMASTTLGLGAVPGPITVRGTIPGLGSLQFTEFAVGPPATLVKTDGDGQRATVGATLPKAFTVKVADAAGTSLPELAVAFSLAAGSGRLSAASVNTDQNGMARTTLTLGAAPGNIVVSATVSGLAPVQFTTTAVPVIAIGAIVNGASFQTGVSPASWATIFGQYLSSTTRSWNPAAEIQNGVLPVELDGVRVLMNAKPASVYSISPTQINVQVPSDLNSSDVSVQVTTREGSSVAVKIGLQSEAPGFFMLNPGQTRQYPAALVTGPTGVAAYLGPPGLLGGNAQTRAARPGDVITLYGTGFGPTSPQVPAGVVFDGVAPLQSLESLGAATLERRATYFKSDS
jgi:uncharacterized protein (TIGR03437 family)